MHQGRYGAVQRAVARFTGSDAVVIVQSVADWTWSEHHASYSRKTPGRIRKVQRECTHLNVAKDVKTAGLAITQWEETCGRTCDNCRLVENVGAVGDKSQRGEMANADAYG